MDNKLEYLRKLIEEDFEKVSKQKWSLPELSDEDIQSASIDYDIIDGYYEGTERYTHFKKGAEWYREQLKNKNADIILS